MAPLAFGWVELLSYGNGGNQIRLEDRNLGESSVLCALQMLYDGLHVVL